MSPSERSLPELWTVRTSEGGRMKKKAGDSFVPASQPWLKERVALLRLFVANDFRARYRAQALGALWSLLQPLVMMGILSVVFTRAFRQTEPNFPIFLLIGLLLWQWISQSLNAATLCFVLNADMVKRTVFPRSLLPIAAVFSYGVNAAVESLALWILIPFFPGAVKLSPALLALPVLLAILVVLLSGISLAVSVLNVIYRDVAYLVSTGLLILYWLTPVIYPPSVLPDRWREIFAWNPLGGVLTAVRGVLMRGELPSAADWMHLLVPTVLVLLVGLMLFRRHEREMLDHV